MSEIILSALIIIALSAGNGFAQPLFNPDKFTTYYLDLDLIVPYGQLGLGSEIDLALDSNGTVIIADPSHARVVRFDPGSQKISAEKIFVELTDRIIGKPRRISIDGKDIWLADPDRREISKIKTDNTLSWHIADFDSPFDWISDIAHAENEALIVLDSGAGSLFRIDKRNKIERIYGSAVFAKHTLVGVAFLNSTVAVADDKAEIWLISTNGQNKKITRYKNNFSPTDITSFRSGFLISDRSGHLWKLDADGKSLKQLILASSFLSEPSRISASGTNVAIADSAKKNILFFSLKPVVTAYQHIFVGEELMEIGFPADALKEFTLAKALGHEWTDLWMLDGRAFYELKKFKKAIVAFQKAVKRSPNDIESLFWLATSYHRLGEDIKAIKNYRLLLDEHPNHVPALTNLGISYAILGRKREAQDVFERAVKLAPDSVEANLSYGKWLLSQKTPEKALIILNAITKTRPDVFETTYYLGLAYARSGDCKNAIPFLEKASKVGPLFSESLLTLSDCYLYVGRIGEAKSALKHIFKISPNHPEALRRLNRINNQGKL